MTNKDCGMTRGLKIMFGVFFGFVTLGMFLIGITYLPFFGILLATIFFMLSILFLLAPREANCYL